MKIFRHTNQQYASGVNANISSTNENQRCGPFLDGRTGPVTAGPFLVESDRNILVSTFTYTVPGGFAVGSNITGTAPNMTLTRAGGDGSAFTADMVGRWLTVDGTASDDGTFLITSFTSATVIGYYNRDGVGHVGTGAGGITWDVTTFALDFSFGRLVKLSNTSPTVNPQVDVSAVFAGTGQINPYDNSVFPIIEVLSGSAVRLGGGCRFDTPSTAYDMSFTVCASANVEAIAETPFRPVATIRADDAANLTDGDYVRVEKYGLQWTFEFNSSGPAATGNILIDTSVYLSAAAIATELTVQFNACGLTESRAAEDSVDDTVVFIYQLPGSVEPVVLTMFSASSTVLAVESTSDIARPWIQNQSMTFNGVGVALETLEWIPWKIVGNLHDNLVGIADWTGLVAKFPEPPQALSSPPNPGALTFTAPYVVLTASLGGTFTADMVGRYIGIETAANPGNVGFFKIVDFINSTNVRFLNPAGVTEGVGAQWSVCVPWYTHDRKAVNHDDLVRVLYHDAMLDAGYNVIGRSSTGSLSFAAQPVDLDVVVLWDGSYKSVFEFESGGGVTPGHHLVTIGGTTDLSVTALVAAINAARGSAAFTTTGCPPCNLVATQYDANLSVAGAGAGFERVVLRQFEYAREGSGTLPSVSEPVLGPNPQLMQMTQDLWGTITIGAIAINGLGPQMTVTGVTIPGGAGVNAAIVGQWVTVSGGTANPGTFLVTAFVSSTSFRYLDPANVGVTGPFTATAMTVVPSAFHASMVGQYITIAGATATPANNGRFIITSVTDERTLRYRNENGAPETFTGTWESKARQADTNEAVISDVALMTYSGMSAGQHPGQMRGRQGAFTLYNGTLLDWTYFSNGESRDLADRYFRRTWIRAIEVNQQPNSIAVPGSGNKGLDWAAWQYWDPWFNNGIASLYGNAWPKGNGTNPVRAPHNRVDQMFAATAALTHTTVGVLPAWGGAPQGTINIFGSSNAHLQNYENTLGIPGGDPWEFDYVVFGDKDEMHLFAHSKGAGGAYMGIGNILEVNQNPHKFCLRGAVTAGASRELNIGPYNPQLLSPPLQIGDRIQISGAGVGPGGAFTIFSMQPPNAGAFIESSTITGFGIVAGSDATYPDYFIRVASLAKAYQVGSVVGEEACPLFIYQGLHTALDTIENFMVQNSANYGDATHRDYSGYATTSGSIRGFGFPGVAGSIASGLTTFDPNQRSGRWGLIPILVKMTNDGEFRGALRYYWLAPSRAGGETYVKTQDDDVYYLAPVWYQQTFGIMGFGPMTALFAGVRGG